MDGSAPETATATIDAPDDALAPSAGGNAGLLFSRLMALCEEAELDYEADEPSLSMVLDYHGDPLLVEVESGAIYLFLPIFDDAEDTPEERREACEYLATALPIPPAYRGMASYRDEPYERTGLLVELLMPRRFSEYLVADGLDLVADIIEGWGRLAAPSGAARVQ